MSETDQGGPVTMASWEFTDTGAIRARFTDGSVVALRYVGQDHEPDGGGSRAVYGFAVADVNGAWIDRQEIRSGVGDEIDLVRALAAWASFARAEAGCPAGYPAERWAEEHRDELDALVDELEPSADERHTEVRA